MHSFDAPRSFGGSVPPPSMDFPASQSHPVNMDNQFLHALRNLPATTWSEIDIHRARVHSTKSRKPPTKVGNQTKSHKAKAKASAPSANIKPKRSKAPVAGHNDSPVQPVLDHDAPRLTMRAKPTKPIVIADPNGQIIHQTTKSAWVYVFN